MAILQMRNKTIKPATRNIARALNILLSVVTAKIKKITPHKMEITKKIL
jgi:hypothetical protein